MLVLVLLLSVPCLLANEDGTSNVIVLTDETFDESLDAGGDWLIEFYAPWCGHCKKLVPIWDELSNTKAFKVAKVDCTIEDDLAKRFGIKGFPTIKFFHDGKFYDYRAARTVEAFTDFVTSGYTSASASPYPDGRPLPTPKETENEVIALDEPVKALDKPVITAGVVDLNTANFEEKTKEGVWLIKFFAPWCGHCKKLAPTWEELGAKEQRTFNVAKVDCVVDGDVCTKFSVRGYPTLKLFVDGKHLVDYSGPRQIDNFISFVDEHTKKALKEEL